MVVGSKPPIPLPKREEKEKIEMKKVTRTIEVTKVTKPNGTVQYLYGVSVSAAKKIMEEGTVCEKMPVLYSMSEDIYVENAEIVKENP